MALVKKNKTKKNKRLIKSCHYRPLLKHFRASVERHGGATELQQKK